MGGDKNILNVGEGIKNERRHVILCADQPDVEGALFQCLHRFEGGLTGNGELDMWVLTDKGLQDREQDIFTQRRGNPNGKMSHAQLLEALQLFFALGNGLESVFYLGKQDFARLC